MRRRKVLYVLHNHPKTRPGGAEAYAFETYLAMRASPDWEPILVAKGGPPLQPIGRLHSGTQFGPASVDDPNQYFCYTDGYGYDWIYGTTTDKELYTKHFRGFLDAIRPDVVHFQHTQFLGYDLIREVRNTLPHAAILYTLHEFMPICHRQGQMVRTIANELCDEESPRRCHECFPDIDPQTFFMRKRFVQSHFALVDRFIAPSHFLLERYVEWGIPRDRILFEDYGRTAVARFASDHDRPRDRFGFFGQFNPYKGADVLLEAMKLLGLASEGLDGEGPVPHVWLHGANLDIQAGEFQTRFRELLESAGDNVTLVGTYRHADLARLMANVDWVVVPSIWWENSPLVIQEAFMHGRPVLCSDIGGMAEKVENGVNGLHFAVGDPEDLARTMARAAGSPGLWETLRAGIPQIYPMDQHVQRLTELYGHLLEGRDASVA
ncbi:MAG: glycosyltransferase family 4 protein [Chloroflexi bacterium]|nr:glycosyltransferase family 4 protein [Chloroflexota bacterium]